MVQAATVELPGLDCGMCGYRTCDELREQLALQTGFAQAVHSSLG